MNIKATKKVLKNAAYEFYICITMKRFTPINITKSNICKYKAKGIYVKYGFISIFIPYRKITKIEMI